MKIDPAVIDCVVFDMDGVVTDTASVHESSWKTLFDDVLEQRAAGSGFDPFTSEDYLRYVDGKNRYDGVASFLKSRGITLPWGDPSEPPGSSTVCGLGNSKNEVFRRHIAEHGVLAYPSTLELIDDLRACGVRVGLISGSRNAEDVLNRAGVAELFEARVDGMVAAELGLPGKPDPAVFIEAAQRMDASPARTVVVEDAISGVQAGRAGGFALVIGVDRAGQAEALAAAGADIVVADLDEVEVAEVHD